MILHKVAQEVPMSTMTASSPPQQQNDQARLELLSNTALLKKVMDNEVSNWKQQQLQRSPSAGEESITSTMEAVTPPSKVDKKAAPAVSTKGGASTPSPTFMETTIPKKNGQGIPVEKSSSAPTSPASSSTATVSPVEQPRMVFLPSSASYASLLLPPGAPAPGVPALSHHQLQTLALAHHHLPQNVKTAMAMMGTASDKVYGGPSSAFQKPYVILKENVPPPYGAATSPIISRQTSPTQSPGERSTRGGTPSSPSYEALLQENRRLQKEMKQKDHTIASLTIKADGLEKQIGELRQLPTGKISHIPIE